MIDWSTNSWLRHLTDIMPWLNEDFDLMGDPATSLRLLFEYAGSRDPLSCYSSEDGQYGLTGDGVQLLESLLASAVEFKEAFELAIEDGHSKTAATNDWNTRWDEFQESTDSIPVVQAEVDKWRIKVFSEFAEEGDLELNPSYQRDLVWSNSDTQKSYELRGIPLPSIISRTPNNKHEMSMATTSLQS